MGHWRLISFIGVCVSLLLFASCGGGGVEQVLNTGGDLIVETSSDSDDTTATNTSTSTASGWDSLPSIPLDTDEDRVVSDASGPQPPGEDGQQVILGSEYLQMAYGTIDGDSLVLSSPEQPEDENDVTQLAYGLYKLPGGTGIRPLSINIECVPDGLDSAYYIGVADYTDGKWVWFGPSTLPEYELDLREVKHQLATHLGNMYFIIVCPPGMGATHSQTTVTWGAPLPGDEPGFPHHLVASDGQFAEQIKLAWVAGANVTGYEIFRKPVLGNQPWESIGETIETTYTDSPLPDYKMFFYRVRAMNSAGPSGFSNIDSGFAGGGDDPYVIRAQVDLNGEPVAGVMAGLVGMGELLGQVRTNENGVAWFNDLAPGRYLVVMHHPALEFNPAVQLVEFTEGSAKLAEVHFNAAPSAVFHSIHGFVVTRPSETEGPGVVPLEGITIEANPVGVPDTVYTVITGEYGSYALTDLPEGNYLVRAVSEGWTFVPKVHQVVVNGNNRPDRRDFFAYTPGEEPEVSDPETPDPVE